MLFNRATHGTLHDRGYADILYGINSIDFMKCWTPEHSITIITW